MGGVLSRLGEDVLDIAELLKGAVALGLKYKAVLQRASSDPGLPVEKPTLPYWMLDPPHPELLDLQGDIPQEADVVIIGSGITGAAAAKTICELSSDATHGKPRVVVLEARQLCSGATGRNGGHIKCTPHSEYARFEKKLGADRARKIVKMQLSHLDLLGEVGEQIPEGEVRKVETVDLFIHQDSFEEAKGEVEVLKEGMPEIEVEVWESGEARKKFGVNEQVVGAVSYSAGALWPFRLVTGVWHQLIHKYSNLVISTHTHVTAVEENNMSSEQPLSVRTSRGDIQTRHVLHATNGYATHLVPMLRGRLTGFLGHMTAQRPGEGFPARHGNASWSVMYSPGFDYVTQRPDREDGSQGDLMLGGAFSRSRDGGLGQFGIWDDGKLSALPLMHLRGSMATLFEPQWGPGSELKSAWTGIMGFTGDSLPLVGPLPPSKASQQGKGILNSAGEWIAAGFNGEGMVWAWLSGTAIALMILGKDEEELERGIGRPGGRLADWYPRGDVAIDAARLGRADLRNLKEWL